MGNITLNKPSGGQLTLAPEDGTSNETVSIPAGGVMAADAPVGKILQVKELGYPDTSEITCSGYSNTTLISFDLTIQEGSKILLFFCSGQTNNSGSATNPACGLWVNTTDISRHNPTGAWSEATNHWFYGVDSRAVINLRGISGALSAGTYTVRASGGAYNGSTVFNYQSKMQGSLLAMEVAA